MSRRATFRVSAGTSLIAACLLVSGCGSKTDERAGTTSTIPDLSTMVTATTMSPMDKLSLHIDDAMADLEKTAAAADAAATNEGDPSQ